MLSRVQLMLLIGMMVVGNSVRCQSGQPDQTKHLADPGSRAPRTSVAGVETPSASEAQNQRSPTPSPAESKADGTFYSQCNTVLKAGSPVDELRKQLEKEVSQLPSQDSEDRSQVPGWFRVYLRRLQPGLPTSGPSQYPRWAVSSFCELLRNQESPPASVK